MAEVLHYGIRVVQTMADGIEHTVEFSGYGVLRELLDEIEAEVALLGWHQAEGGG